MCLCLIYEHEVTPVTPAVSATLLDVCGSLDDCLVHHCLTVLCIVLSHATSFSLISHSQVFAERQSDQLSVKRMVTTGKSGVEALGGGI